MRLTAKNEREEMSISAKFRVKLVTPNPGFDLTEVLLVPVTTDGQNTDWSMYNPSGAIRLSVTNLDALAQFEVGKEFSVLFKADDE